MNEVIKKKARLKEHLINSINDGMMIQIFKTANHKKTNEITSEQVLSWARRVDV